jgi:hypothetical protein
MPKSVTLDGLTRRDICGFEVLQIATICCASDSVHSMMQLPEIYQFHACLRGIRASIWRRLLVRSFEISTRLGTKPRSGAA